MGQREIVNAAFARMVNLAPRELELWLAGEASAAAPGTEGPDILRVLRTPPAERTDDDVALMDRTVAHIRAERERRPDGDVTDSVWRHGLMNFGHDPMTWSPQGPPATANASAAKAAPDPREVTGRDQPRG